MKQTYLTKEDMAELKESLMGFVKRVTSADGAKTPEEVTILPGMIQALETIFIFRQ